MNAPRFLPYGAAVLVLAAVVSLAAANSGGPPISSTGTPKIGSVPAEATCNRSGCHAGNALNNGQGQIELLGLPAAYDPGASYEVTVRLGSTSNSSASRRWGFEMTAVGAADGKSTNAGTWTIGEELRKASNPVRERDYVSHNFAGIHQGSASPSEWTLTWNAPAEDQGTILFYFAGNAANGNGGPSGDFIYTGNLSLPGPGTPVEPLGWGALKRLDLTRR